MTSNPMITKEDLRKIHLYCYEDVQEFLSIHKTLDEEIEKSEAEMDKALVEECLKYVEVVMGEDDDVDEEKLDAKYQEIMARVEQTQPAQPAKVIKSKKRAVRKFFFILAATITVLFTTLTIAAKVYGYKNAWEFVRQKAVELQGFDCGETATSGKITLIGNGEVETFASFKDFLEKENLNIMYPQRLPEDLKIDTISKYPLENGNCIYSIQFNSQTVSMMVRNYFSVELDLLSDAEILSFQEKTFYIKPRKSGSYQAICQHEGFEYTIDCKDYDTLIQIIENMKGSQS